MRDLRVGLAITARRSLSKRGGPTSLTVITLVLHGGRATMIMAATDATLVALVEAIMAGGYRITRMD
jgi:hypothetical protein